MDAAGRSPRQSFGPSRRNGSRGRRPGEHTWEIEMHRLANAHEQELFLAPDALVDVAQRLGVSKDAVARRFGEFARRAERASPIVVDARVLGEAARQADFVAAARHLRTQGVAAPSVVIERLFQVAPGPEARMLRARETARRLAVTSAQLRRAA